MKGGTRSKLLEAAEKILLEQGVHALTVRRVGDISGMNPALITYHFGGVAGMLEELQQLNLAPLMKKWDELTKLENTGDDKAFVAQALEIWLAPLLYPPAFNKQGRALVVMDEIASHGDEEVSVKVVRDMALVAHVLSERILPLLPHLTAEELRMRLRFIAGAALGPPPRVRTASEVSPELRVPVTLDSLLRFAKAALEIQ